LNAARLAAPGQGAASFFVRVNIRRGRIAADCESAGTAERVDLMVEVIPRNVLFGNPQRVNPRIAPDGERLAWVAPRDGVLNVWVAPLRDGVIDEAAARPVTDDTDRGIRVFFWMWDGRHLVYLRDTTGDENRHLWVVDLESGAARNLTPVDGVQARIVGIRPSRPGEILVGLNHPDPRLHDVYRVDVATGDRNRVVANSGYVGWLPDEDLVVRAALAPRKRGGFDLVVRDDADADWRPLIEIPADDVPPTGLLSFSGDGRSLLAVSSIGTETGELTRIDVATGRRDRIDGDPEADVVGAMLHPDTREPQVVAVRKERNEYRVLHAEVADDFAAVSALHRGDWELLGRDGADRRWLIAFSADTSPASYYLYDRTDRAGRLLFDSRPELARYPVAEVEPFEFTARDGLRVHGYATFPPGGAREDLPTVLLVHGGPQQRDTWRFEPEAQWLANRGYLCIQVNFRGSTGYGKAFVTAGDREWGGRMQDDLTDAVDHVVKRGWADTTRVAIFGRSYGGFAALAGAAFTPDVFRCAVDVVGPSSLLTLFATMPPYWTAMADQLYRRIGDPRTEEDFLWSRSPLSRVADIRIPVFIAQGANDARVKQTESAQIVEALTAAGIEHEYLLFPDEGHCFDKPRNRLTFYSRAEHFLARHLGGRCEA
jgi:dipeptidyl aminopeptidase/acylaminoacyl peptidase